MLRLAEDVEDQLSSQGAILVQLSAQVPFSAEAAGLVDNQVIAHAAKGCAAIMYKSCAERHEGPV